MVTIKFSQLYGIAVAAEIWFEDQNSKHHTFNKEVAMSKIFKRRLLRLKSGPEDEIFLDTLPF